MLRIVVLNHSRPKNVGKLIDTFKKYFPMAIINNNPQEMFEYIGNGVDVINNEHNYYCMERWIRCFEYPEPYKLILDDDILPSLSLIKRMLQSKQELTGIYGKLGVDKANTYLDLEDVWEDKEVDFLVGSCMLIKQTLLDTLHEDIEKIGYPKRGDDIVISYLAKQKSKKPLQVTTGKFAFLPEDGVGLNTEPDHFSRRWDVVQKFRNIGWTD